LKTEGSLAELAGTATLLDDATYTYFGVDEDGNVRKGSVEPGTVSEFAKGRFEDGWLNLEILDNAGVHVAGISETYDGKHKRSNWRWFSNVP
jgi:hypothetical protein